MPAEINPDLALDLAKATADAYSQATEELIRIVADRARRGVSFSDGWAERKLLETTKLRNEARRVVERLTARTPGLVSTAVRSAYTHGSGPSISGGFGVTHTRAVDRLIAETTTRLISTHGQIVRSTIDAYREVIAQTSLLVNTGTLTVDQARRKALDDFAKRGITGFTDKAGRRWRLDRYAEMATRTATGRAQVAGTLDRLVDDHRDLVIVSDHSGTCRVCAPWEAKVLSITGASTGRTTDGDGRQVAIAGTVADAQAAGLQHPSCRHALTSWTPGLTVAPDPVEPSTEGDDRRRARQAEDEKRRLAARRKAAGTREVTRAEIDAGKLDEAKMTPAELRFRRQRQAAGHK